MFESTLERTASACSSRAALPAVWATHRRRRSTRRTPTPSRTSRASMTRDWLHASTHGMARRSEICWVCFTRCGPAADVELADLRERRRRGEVFDEAVGLVNEFAVGTTTAGGEVVEDRVRRSDSLAQPPRRRAATTRSWAARIVSRLRCAETGSAYLAAMISPCSVIRSDPCTARRLRKDGLVAGPATAADGAATTVEQPQPDARLFRGVHQVEFGAVERPVGGEVSAVPC